MYGLLQTVHQFTYS